MFFKEVPLESDPLNFFTPDKNTLGVTPDKKTRRMQTPEDCYPLRIVTPGGFSPRRENPWGSLPGGLLPLTRVGASFEHWLIENGIAQVIWWLFGGYKLRILSFILTDLSWPILWMWNLENIYFVISVWKIRCKTV